MNNTDKLLRAFIEASGYEIETIDSHQECIFSIDDTEKLNPFHLPVITDYKVTKKKGYLPLYEMMYRSVMCGTCYANRNVCNCEK